MSANNFKTAVAPTVLAGTSGYALFECTDLKYARIAFGLYLVDGGLGVIELALPKRNAKQALDFIDRISSSSYTPLIAAEAALFLRFDDKYCSYAHLVFPVSYLVLTELFKKDIDKKYVDLSTVCNSLSIFLSASIPVFLGSNYNVIDYVRIFTEEDLLFGGLTASYNLSAFLESKYNSIQYFLLIAAANLLALQFFETLFT